MDLCGNIGRYVDDKKAANRPQIYVIEPAVKEVLPCDVAESALVMGILWEFVYYRFEVKEMSEKVIVIGCDWLKRISIPFVWKQAAPTYKALSLYFIEQTACAM